MEEKTLGLLEKKLAEGQRDEFYLQFIGVYQEVNKKAAYNRDRHFSQQNGILWTSMWVSLLNIIVSFLTSLNAWNWVISLATSASSVCAILVTFLVAKKGTNQYLETWFRHQKHKTALEVETLKYVFGYRDYQGMSDEESATKFISRIIELWSENQAAFVSNMMQYSEEDKKGI